MDLKVINGGRKSTGLSTKERIEKIKLLSQHMKDIEANMALINQEAKRIDWKQLETLSEGCLKSVITVLSLIKNTEKSGFITLPSLKKDSKPQLRVVTEKEIQEDIITEFEVNNDK